ncbi:MAG: prepilin-type N-terminal cleavage/methylation domain-containing protein [Candidatus Zixiibacteriota bacterium]
MRSMNTNQRGFTLIEIVLVVIILGILATIASLNFSSTVETVKQEATMAEMQSIINGIVGNPLVVADGHRTDFGYVGDIGALPPNLDALVVNPGYPNWKGPYVNPGITSDDFKKDGWNQQYIYVDTLLRSVGSGTNIDKLIAINRAALLSNTIQGYITDANGSRPNGLYVDSLLVALTYPNGSGALSTTYTNPDSKGRFQFVNTPVGVHNIRVIYIPDHDTSTYTVAVNPGRSTNLQITFPADLW